MSGLSSSVTVRHPAMLAQGGSMLTHGQIWTAIDAIAARYGLTASGLAKRAGLDPTTFNKSKRISPDGRLRWPSTESLAKVLDATGASLDEFMALVGSAGPQPSSRTLPLLGVADAGHDGCFAPDGQPSGLRWDEIVFPDLPQKGVYALEVSGDSMVPLFRKGDILVCSQTAPVRRGDRVVVKTKTGELVVKELKRRTAKTVELHSLNPQHADMALPSDSIAWIARVMWVSQ
jgi:phage repressor protein C with HTH and peptisase S24 domain